MLVALVGALLAGSLTTLAPCSLSLLPVIVGGSVQGSVAEHRRGATRAVVVTASLAASVVAFTLLLKASTVLIDAPPAAWQWLSGGLLVALGVVSLLPGLWDRVALGTGLSRRSAVGLNRAAGEEGMLGAALTGAALGPVFTSCSPLYGYVVVTVLPSEPGRGLTLLAAYVAGLAAVLLAVAVGGQRLVRRLHWAADPHSLWRRGLGVVFVAVGVLVATGLMQDLEAWLVASSPIRPWEIGADIGRQ